MLWSSTRTLDVYCLLGWLAVTANGLSNGMASHQFACLLVWSRLTSNGQLDGMASREIVGDRLSMMFWEVALVRVGTPHLTLNSSGVF